MATLAELAKQLDALQKQLAESEQKNKDIEALRGTGKGNATIPASTVKSTTVIAPYIQAQLVDSRGNTIGVITLNTKEFNSGSDGFYGNGKVKIDGVDYQGQAQLVRIKSKLGK